MKRLALLLAWLALAWVSGAADYRGAQLVGFSDFATFPREGEVLTSPEVAPAIPWNELVMSWNLRGDGEATIEARVIFPDTTTGWYRLAVWSAKARHSITNQADAFAVFALDTLMVKRPGGKAQARITLQGGSWDDLKYLAFSFADTKAKPLPLDPNRAAWRKELKVRGRSQFEFTGGLNWCSPTGYAMILDYWARELKRPELAVATPEAANQAYDPSWSHAGNWSFNTAIGGRLPGMRSYVTRLTDISEIEDWIAAGVPVAASVSYNRLKGENKSGKGHLIVCIGFDKDGDVIAHDPGAPREKVRCVFPRERFRAAWADSGNTVYLTYPLGAKIPEARMGHWEEMTKDKTSK